MSATAKQIKEATRDLAKAIAVEPRTLKEAGLIYRSEERRVGKECLE